MDAEPQSKAMDHLRRCQKTMFIDLSQDEDVCTAIHDLDPQCGCPDVDKKTPDHAFM